MQETVSWLPSRSNNCLITSNSNLKWSECRTTPRYTQIEPYAGEFERRRPAFQRGVWGSEPPDPGSAPTRKIATHKYTSSTAPLATTTSRSLKERNYIAYRFACDNSFPIVNSSIATEFKHDLSFLQQTIILLSPSPISHLPSSPQFTNALDRLAPDRNLRIYYRVSRLSYRHTLASRHRLLS